MNDPLMRVAVFVLCLPLLAGGPLYAQAPPMPGAAQPSVAEHPLVPAIALARKAKDKAAALNDYEGTFTKKELIGPQMLTQMMKIRVRHKPFSVYMVYAAPNEGREVLYDQGQDPDNLIVHEGPGLKSLAGTLNLPIRDPRVLAEARHPVNDLGIERLAELVIQQWEFESKYGEIDVKYFPDAKMGQIPCEVLVATHPRPRKQFPYHQTRLFIEKSTGLPLRVQNYGFPQQANVDPPLVEDYAYTTLKTNVGLGPIHFSRTNPDYNFQ